MTTTIVLNTELPVLHTRLLPVFGTGLPVLHTGLLVINTNLLVLHTGLPSLLHTGQLSFLHFNLSPYTGQDYHLLNLNFSKSFTLYLWLLYYTCIHSISVYIWTYWCIHQHWRVCIAVILYKLLKWDYRVLPAQRMLLDVRPHTYILAYA